MAKHIIWTNDLGEISRDSYQIDYPNMTDEEYYEMVYQDIEDNYEAEELNLNRELNENIVLLNNMDLWNGHYLGFAELGTNLSDILKAGQYDYITYYSDNKDIWCRDVHHDGANMIRIRVWKEGLTDRQKENFRQKCYEGNLNKNDVSRYTRSLAPIVDNIYGW